MKKRYVWVVEMKFDGENQYSPTVGCGLTREDATNEMAQWRKRNPEDRFRIAKYEAKP